MDEANARAILHDEIRTRLALREARARAYLGYMAAGATHSAAWQQVNLDTMTLQTDWEMAKAEERLLRLIPLPQLDEEETT